MAVKKLLAFCVFTLAIASSAAIAAPITFTGNEVGAGNDGETLSATATFDNVGGNLVITLTNTGTYDTNNPADILTAVFFTLSGDPTLTPISVMVAAGSTAFFEPAPSGGNVGGEWAYANGIGGPGGADEGVSSVGLGLFGPMDLFPPGTNLQGPASPNGLQYGITSAGDNLATGNTPVTGTNALVQNSVVITLSGLPLGFDPSATGAITSVSFQYGTSLSEPRIPGNPPNGPPDPPNNAPEPATLLLLGSGLAAMGLLRRKRE
ncbi:MAG: XDD4 family exosortase-dependent surface protein [Deltaproteobacteria bacterium]